MQHYWCGGHWKVKCSRRVYVETGRWARSAERLGAEASRIDRKESVDQTVAAATDQYGGWYKRRHGTGWLAGPASVTAAAAAEAKWCVVSSINVTITLAGRTTGGCGRNRRKELTYRWESKMFMPRMGDVHCSCPRIRLPVYHIWPATEKR